MACSASKKFVFSQAHRKTLISNLLKDSSPMILLSFAESQSFKCQVEVDSNRWENSKIIIMYNLNTKTIFEHEMI